MIIESALITIAPPLPPLPFLNVNDERTIFEFSVKIDLVFSPSNITSPVFPHLSIVTAFEIVKPRLFVPV